MAEAMLRRMAALRGVTIAVRSAGISTIDGLPVSSHAAEALRQREIEHKSTSLALTSEAVSWADLILTMTSNHKRGLLQWYPEAVDKAYTLKEYSNMDAKVLADIEELEQLYSELHMKQALGQKLSASERSRLLELEQRIPSFDIVDPFGGSQSIYDSSAHEIEAALVKLLDKLTRR